MRYLLFLVAIFFLNLSVKAQGIAYSDLRYAGYEESSIVSGNGAHEFNNKKCRATKVGTGIMIAGGGVAIIGVLGVISPWAQHQTFDVSKSRIAIASSVAVGGVSLGIVGIVVHIIGQDYDDRHGRRMHITTDKNRVGLAWQF